MITYRDLWAKTDPYKSLWQHMLDVGLTAMALLNESRYSILLDNISSWLKVKTQNALMFVCYIASLHDIGKCHPVFQGMDPGFAEILKCEGLYQLPPEAESFRHEQYSSKVLLRILKEQNIFKRDVRRNISAVVGLHHQGKRGTGCAIREDISEAYEKMQRELEAMCFEAFDFGEIEICENEHIDAAFTEICAIVILADWIASGKLAESEDKEADTASYLKHAYKKAVAAVHECGFEKTTGLEPVRDYCDMWSDITQPRQMQREVERSTRETPQLMIIEAPMGEGKTEAAILAATRMSEGKRGLYFALPTAATGNLMYERIEKLFSHKGIGNVRLLHGSAWLIDEQSSMLPERKDIPEISRWLMPLRRGLLGQYAVGTVDQAMMSVLRVRYGVLRLMGLSDKVLIIDEVHAYDAYMTEIIKKLLAWCGELGIPVILLSATLPKAKREQLVRAYIGNAGFISTAKAYPLITRARSGQTAEIPAGEAAHKRELYIYKEHCLGDVERTASIAVDFIKEHDACICVMANTVMMAQEVYKAIKAQVNGNIWLGLLHSAFPAYRRNEIEKECASCFGKRGKRPDKAILVATQIVEQSCDYSFDHMISEIAPIDLLLQRSGRVLRHEGVGLWGKIPPAITVILPEKDDFGPSGFVYYEYLLGKTRELLENTEVIAVPGDMRRAIEAVYADEPKEGQLEQWAEMAFSDKLQSSAAESVAMKMPQKELFGLGEAQDIFAPDEEETLNAVTRLSEPSRKAILIDEADMPDESAIGNCSIEAARVLLRYGLTIRHSRLIIHPDSGYRKPVEGKGRLEGCYIYAMKNGRLSGEGKEGGLVYTLDNELGLIIKKKGDKDEL